MYVKAGYSTAASCKRMDTYPWYICWWPLSQPATQTRPASGLICSTHSMLQVLILCLLCYFLYSIHCYSLAKHVKLALY